MLADVLDRAISVEAARAEYGVVLSPDGTAVDHDATKECREGDAPGPRAHPLDLRPGRRARPRGLRAASDGRGSDVVVIGGEIVGSAIAYQLARRGVGVVLVERNEIAGEQSGRNWGFVRQQGRDPAEVPLMMEANRIWRGLEQELGADIEWVQGGNLALAAAPELSFAKPRPDEQRLILQLSGRGGIASAPPGLRSP